MSCYVKESAKSIPIIPIVYKEYENWIIPQHDRLKAWLQADIFKAEAGMRSLVKDEHGKLEKVLLGVESYDDYWAFAGLPRLLPEGIYHIEAELNEGQLERAVLGWGMGTYQFTVYKKLPPINAKLVMPKECNAPLIENYLTSIFLIRDLINTPTDDFGPQQLAEAAQKLATDFQADFKQIVGEKLLTENFPAIYTVGKGSANAPRLIELTWGNKKHPAISLVGKGVCFDSGGLDIKPASGMLLMKKDMAGAAHVLGLARMIMAMELPVYLHVLIPAVENMVSGNAYHPGDVIKTRKGITVEVTNTDAEGRLILCDALYAAAQKNPEIIIDFATLTGAARIALGPELPALFSPQNQIAADLVQSGLNEQDPVWPLPLYKPYRRYLDSIIADMTNASLNHFAGCITAALFLNEFVENKNWVHLDIMAWNPEMKFGRIVGGEAQALRTVFGYLMKKYSR